MREALADKRQIRPRGRKSCFFEANKIEPSFTDTAVLRKFLTERGKIVPADKSGVCAGHQRRLSKVIKQARLMGLLTYTER